MTRTFTPCKDCYERLFVDYIPAAGLWLDLCDGLSLEQPFIVAKDLCTCTKGASCSDEFRIDIDYLEIRGFVITHEVERPFTVIKILGFESNGNICIHRH